MFSLREKAGPTKSLQKEGKVHGFLSSLIARIVELEYSLEMDINYLKEANTTIMEIKYCTEKAMDRLRNEVNTTLQKTLKRVYEAFNQAVEQLETLHSSILVPRSQLDLNKVSRDRALVEDDSAMPQDRKT